MKPHNASFSFRGEEIGRLVEFINHVQSMPLKHPRAMRIADGELRGLVLTKLQAANLVRDNEDLFKEVVRQALTTEDLVAIGYRKRQLQVFERLLADAQYFEQTKARLTAALRRCGNDSLRRTRGSLATAFSTSTSRGGTLRNSNRWSAAPWCSSPERGLMR